MNEGIENCYRVYIIASSFKTKLTRKSQVIIIQIWKLKRVGKTSEEELKKLANALVDGYSGGSFSISLATFGALGFPFLIVG
jgi:propanediol dehydratase small subunit